jgi:hypothetical protein
VGSGGGDTFKRDNSNDAVIRLVAAGHGAECEARRTKLAPSSILLRAVRSFLVLVVARVSAPTDIGSALILCY